MARKRKLRRLGRANQKAAQELLDELEELAQRKAGGSPNNPITVSSPVQVDSKSEAIPCPRCEGPMRLIQHTADTIDGERLRVADCRCVTCGVARKFFFQLENPLQS